MTQRRRILAAVILAICLVLPACSKKRPADDSAASPPESAGATASQPPATSPVNATTEPDIRADQRPLFPFPHYHDELAQPTVRLSVNQSSAAEIPQGWPVVVMARVFGAADIPMVFSPEDLTIAVADSSGAPMDWPLKHAKPPSTGPTTRIADGIDGYPCGWSLLDSSAIAPGSYRITVKLLGADAGLATVTITAPRADATPADATTRFYLAATASTVAGDFDNALKLAEQRLQIHPKDILALQVKGDALAALGRSKDALRAYVQELNEFVLEHPKPTEPPEGLLQLIANWQRAQ